MKHGIQLLFTTSTLLLLTTGASAQETITIDSKTTYQTMRGWENTAWIADPCDPAFPALRDIVIDRAVNQVGIDRLRLEVRSGVENTTDYYADWIAAGCPGPPDQQYTRWRDNRYATVNDNNDPNTINWNGFHFSELDWIVENIILPYKTKMAKNGEDLFINLCYVAFTSQINGGTYHHDDPQEYAEFVLATYLHLQNKYGFVPDTWEILLEPDNVSQWDGTLIGEAVVATAARLTTAGFTPKFVAPSNTNMGNAITYFDDMIAVPGALQYLEEYSYHRYAGVSKSNLKAIADRAVQHNLSTAMLEWWFDNATHEVLYEDLTLGRNSAWQGSVLAGLFNIDVKDPQNPTVSIRDVQKFNRQYFKFVRREAVRIDAQSDGNNFKPVAFVNKGKRFVVVVNTDTGGPFRISGLPAGIYGLKYTTNADYNINLPPVRVAPGKILNAQIPDAGVITIYDSRLSKRRIRSIPANP